MMHQGRFTVKVFLVFLFSVFVAGCGGGVTDCSSPLVTCAILRSYEVDPEASAPWPRDSFIVKGYCDKGGQRWCLRKFLGVTKDHKIILQDFYTDYAGKLAEKLTDEFTVITVEDAKQNLFYVHDGVDGFYMAYRNDGTVFNQGHFKNGMPHGYWVYYFPCGEVESGTYINGEKEGAWVMKDADGNIMGSDLYKNGQLINSH